MRDVNNTRPKIGILHSIVGFHDGVSIVIEQLAYSLQTYLDIPKKDIYFLTGDNHRHENSTVMTHESFSTDYYLNRLFAHNFSSGFTEEIIDEFETAIEHGVDVIEHFVNKNNIDIIISHNTCFPDNFILSLSLSRYNKRHKNTAPVHIIWWHDSHLERVHYTHPCQRAKEYINEGLPGPHVDHIVFINSLQWPIACEYFKEIGGESLASHLNKHHSVIYNTTDAIEHDRDTGFRVQEFFKEYEVEKTLLEKESSVKKTIFCLQHTRIVDRKRIDIALRFCYELLRYAHHHLKEYKTVYFFISGVDTFKTGKQKLVDLNRELQREYNTTNVILEFANSSSDIEFKEIPSIFSYINGIATYFSEVEGFGNNLLEVLAGGLVPITYTYPVYNADIKQFHFEIIPTDSFEITNSLIESTFDLIEDKAKREVLINKNISIIEKEFSHRMIASKMKAIFQSLNKIEIVKEEK